MRCRQRTSYSLLRDSFSFVYQHIQNQPASLSRCHYRRSFVVGLLVTNSSSFLCILFRVRCENKKKQKKKKKKRIKENRPDSEKEKENRQRQRRIRTIFTISRIIATIIAKRFSSSIFITKDFLLTRFYFFIFNLIQISSNFIEPLFNSNYAISRLKYQAFLT